MSKPHRCTICTKRFKTKILLNTHTLIHSNEKSFKCEICSKAFQRKTTLQTHLLTHFKIHGLTKSDILSMPLNVLCLQYKPFVKSKDFTCATCSKVCNSRNHLRSHMIKHSFSYKYCCGICTKSFKSSEGLRLHFGNLHRKYYDEYKDYSYEDEMNFAPSVGKKFMCDICSHWFTTRKSIKVHMLIHMNLWPFVCEVCSKGFRVRTRLNVHLRTHACMDGVTNEEDTDHFENQQQTENITDPKLFNCKVVLTRDIIPIVVKNERGEAIDYY